MPPVVPRSENEPSISEKHSVSNAEISSHLAPIQSLARDSSNSFQHIINDSKAELNNATEMLRNSIASAQQKAYHSIRYALHPIVQFFSETHSHKGTVLRPYIANTRRAINQKAFSTHMRYIAWKSSLCEHSKPLRTQLYKATEQAYQMSAFAQSHPNAAITFLAMVIGVPSLVLRGKWAATRNVLLATGAASAGSYGIVFWKRDNASLRHAKKDKC